MFVDQGKWTASIEFTTSACVQLVSLWKIQSKDCPHPPLWSGVWIKCMPGGLSWSYMRTRSVRIASDSWVEMDWMTAPRPNDSSLGNL